MKKTKSGTVNLSHEWEMNQIKKEFEKMLKDSSKTKPNKSASIKPAISK